MSSVCPACARRAWLVASLGARLDLRAGDLARLWRVLELADAELIDALAGRGRDALHSAHAEYRRASTETARKRDTDSICRHHRAYPTCLRSDALAPDALHVRGGIGRLERMLDSPVIAIVGTRKASDYGMEIARSLARELAASGLTIASTLEEGIPSAVHAGALEGGGSTLTVIAGDIERCSPAWCGQLYHRITSSGCALCEIAQSGRWRRWWQPGRARTLALLAELVIVVEAREHPWELASARIAHSRGRAVAAVPGRVSSPASRGTNALLTEGTPLVRNPQDALDLLYGAGIRHAPEPARHAPEPAREVEPRLRRILELVGDGIDTLAKLTADGSEPAALALALSELELQGLLLRGDGGRYLLGTPLLYS
jgi:DNA processing protein